MEPYYQDGAVTIYHGDCRQILPTLPKVDFVLTDPPYGINYQSNMRASSDKFSKIANDNNEMRFEVYPKMYDILNDNSCGIFFCSFKNYAYDFIELSKYFDIKNCIVWSKGGGWDR